MTESGPLIGFSLKPRGAAWVVKGRRQ